MKPLDSNKFSKAELDAIINAFYDIADVIDTHQMGPEYGMNDGSSVFGSLEKSRQNFIHARAFIYRETGH